MKKPILKCVAKCSEVEINFTKRNPSHDTYNELLRPTLQEVDTSTKICSHEVDSKKTKYTVAAVI